MASYVEELADDRARVQKALENLIEAQDRKLVETRELLQVHMKELDQCILRTFIFRNNFGATQETMNAELETEVASKPVTEAMRVIERETRVLAAYREALEQVNSGKSLEMLGKLPVAEVG
jgi:hypothetical protein